MCTQAAARFGHLECVNLLLNADAEASLVGGKHTRRRVAIFGEHKEIISTLIAHQAEGSQRLHSMNEEWAKAESEEDELKENKSEEDVMGHGMCDAEFQLEETDLFELSLSTWRKLIASMSYSGFACPVCLLIYYQGDCREAMLH